MVQAVRDSWVWNVTVYDTNSKTYTDPVSGKDYALSHLSGIDNHSMKFETKIEQEKVKGSIDVRVVFDHHCYTREKNATDTLPVLVTDKYDDGTQKERVFDVSRYDFTFNLLNIIKNIDHKLCLGSRRNLKANKVIRVEHRDKRNPRKGTYIVMKMKRFSSDSMGFTLYVETCHARNNMPPGMDLSNVERKHMLILGDWLKEQHEDVILEAKKP